MNEDRPMDFQKLEDEVMHLPIKQRAPDAAAAIKP